MRDELNRSYPRFLKIGLLDAFYAGSGASNNRLRTSSYHFEMHIFSEMTASGELNKIKLLDRSIERREQSSTFTEAFFRRALTFSKWVCPVANSLSRMRKRLRWTTNQSHNWLAHHSSSRDHHQHHHLLALQIKLDTTNPGKKSQSSRIVPENTPIPAKINANPTSRPRPQAAQSISIRLLLSWIKSLYNRNSIIALIIWKYQSCIRNIKDKAQS